MDDIYKNPIESSIFHKGTSNGTRTIITIGEVKGIMEHQKANGPSGVFHAIDSRIEGKNQKKRDW